MKHKTNSKVTLFNYTPSFCFRCCSLNGSQLTDALMHKSSTFYTITKSISHITISIISISIVLQRNQFCLILFQRFCYKDTQIHSKYLFELQRSCKESTRRSNAHPKKWTKKTIEKINHRFIHEHGAWTDRVIKLSLHFDKMPQFCRL